MQIGFSRTRGFTLIDVLVGTSLTLIIFFGIFTAFQLGIKVVGKTQNQITALALANQKIEEVRNLPYSSVGTLGGFPEGILPATQSIVQNNIEYEISARVDFVIDVADGVVPPEDECPQDYKRVEVKVSWLGKLPGEVTLTSDVAPQNLAQECAIGGGILSIAVFNAYGLMLSSPLIEVRDPTTDTLIKSASPMSGQHYFSLAPATYKVLVSKSGYNSERTYGIDEITTPEKPHLSVLEDQITQASFSIDQVSHFSIQTLSPWGTDNFSDSFNDQSKISESSSVMVSQGEVKLAQEDGLYLASGYLISIPIAPISNLGWDQLVWSDIEPQNTDLKYQVYYFSDPDWLLVPDLDLVGNSSGFDFGPVDLSGLNPATYAQLKLRANFSTNEPTQSPVLTDWQVSWITDQPFPIPNADFALQGAKLIGFDQDEMPVYKYSESHVSDATGQITIANLERDSYTFSSVPASGLDLISTDPAPQPIDLAPDVTQPVALYLQAENSLLVTAQNRETLAPIFAAAIRLYRTDLSYDTTQLTNASGQVYFIPLELGTYTLEASAAGYAANSTTLSVSGDLTRIISLEQVE